MRNWLNTKKMIIIGIIINIPIGLINIYKLQDTWYSPIVSLLFVLVLFAWLQNLKHREKMFILFVAVFIFCSAVYDIFRLISQAMVPNH